MKYMRTITGHTRNCYKTNIEITKKPQFGQHAELEKVLDVTCKLMSRKRIPRVVKNYTLKVRRNLRIPLKRLLDV